MNKIEQVVQYCKVLIKCSTVCLCLRAQMLVCGWVGGGCVRWGNGFHSSGEEAVSHSVGVSFNVPEPLSRGKRHKKFVSRVGGVCSYTTGPPSNPVVIYRVRWWKRTAHNPLCCFHHPGPTEVRCNVDSYKLNVVHPLHLLPVNEERDVFHSSGSPNIHNNLLGLAGVQDKIIV